MPACLSLCPTMVLQLALLRGVFADGGLDAVDVAVVEVFEAGGGEPFVPSVAEHELQRPGAAVSRPFSQPSALAASAAMASTSADFSAASASRSPFFPSRPRGVLAGGAARRRAGLPDLLVHLDDLPHRRRELGVPGDLAAHLAHLARRELTGDGLPPTRRPGPKEPWLVPGMLRGRARAVRLHTPAPVLAHRPPTYVSHTLGLDGHSAPTVRRSRRSSKRLGMCSGEGSPSRVHIILD